MAVADNIFKDIFFDENVWISIKISLNFIPRSPISPALVQIMAWHCPRTKPLSETVMFSLLMYIMCHSASIS